MGKFYILNLFRFYNHRTYVAVNERSPPDPVCAYCPSFVGVCMNNLQLVGLPDRSPHGPTLTYPSEQISSWNISLSIILIKSLESFELTGTDTLWLNKILFYADWVLADP